MARACQAEAGLLQVLRNKAARATGECKPAVVDQMAWMSSSKVKAELLIPSVWQAARDVIAGGSVAAGPA